MPGSQGDDEAADSPDWTARAKALEFLSWTLDFLSKDLLKPSQVRLLISFFGAMFDIDHKAGIMASATALSRITAMKAFQPSYGHDIIQKVCALKDDFPRQVAKTRLSVFELLRSLITTPEVAADLQKRHGPSSEFMTALLQLCRNERDPSCLLVWFDILTYFLREYSPEKEIIEDVYGTFKAYFPITLPRTSQSGITPEELKMALRACFTSNYQLGLHAFPFLLGKMDQGDAVTVNVKIDVLKTIKACIESYNLPEESVAPYVDQIWSSLKYEVRNGEIEDTIWATLEVLKTFAIKLKGDSLRDYALTVTRDCVNDLSNTTYTAPAGRLLVSVLSASPVAFVLMVSPAITHIKDNLRHPKSPSHSQDLLRILHVILETRLLLVDAEMATEERSDFAAVDSIFKTLYDDVYKGPVQLGSKADASHEDLKLATQAVHGAGAMICQRPATSEKTQSPTEGRLLPEETRLQIFQSLFNIITQWTPGDENSRSTASDDLLNETIKALQRAVTSSPKAFEPLVTQALAGIQTSWEEQGAPYVPLIQSMSPILAYVGCSELPKSRLDAWRNFCTLKNILSSKLEAAIDAETDVKVWSAFVAGLQVAVRHFNDACLNAQPTLVQQAWSKEQINKIMTKNTLSEDEAVSASVDAIHSHFLITSLSLARKFYRKATKLVKVSPSTGKNYIATLPSDHFTGSDKPAENQYLHLLGSLAGFIIHEMSEEQQLSLQIQDLLHLFRPESADAETAPYEVENLEALERVDVFSINILNALRPSVVSQLVSCPLIHICHKQTNISKFESGSAQDLLISGVTKSHLYTDPTIAAVTRSILTILANKHKMETIEPVMTILTSQAEKVLSDNDTATFDTLITIAAGLLRRCSSAKAQPLLHLLREASKSATFANRVEIVVAPQSYLTKENYAIVKPLWMQKLYFELVKPALGQQDSTVGVAVLGMVKHMPFSIYEDDVESILRIALSSGDLGVLKNILVSNSGKARAHCKSIITICVAAFSNTSASENGKLALEIVGGLPGMFGAQYVVPHRRLVERQLALACGDRSRGVRRVARSAREAWDGVR